MNAQTMQARLGLTPVANPTEVSEDTPVLLQRPVRDDATEIARVGDDRWDLTPAIFEAHAAPVVIDWRGFPAALRPAFKQYFWLLLNVDPDQLIGTRHRWSIITVKHEYGRLTQFAGFLASRGRKNLHEVDPQDLDGWVAEVQSRDTPLERKLLEIRSVRSMWEHRSLLPASAQLSILIPWNGQRPEDLLGHLKARPAENKTPRIDELTMSRLLSWSIEIVDHLAEPITVAARLRRTMSEDWAARHDRKSPRFGTTPGPSTRSGRPSGRQMATQVISELQSRGLPIPGRTAPAGNVVDTRRIAQMLGIGQASGRSLIQALERSGLPIADTTVLHPPVEVSIAGAPLRVAFTWDEVPKLEHHLQAAALVVISYLSGMRPDEVLNLERGCAHTSGEMNYLTGKAYKGIRDDAGAKDPRGRVREVPWVVCAPVMRAVRALESLHDQELLFVSRTQPVPGHRPITLQPALRLARITEMIDWVNRCCSEQGRPDPIPEDAQHPTLYLSRFRRTLAWHIARRPQGIVAASVQYGHLGTQMTQGYAGTLASGFPDQYSFEALLQRLEDLGAAHERLDAGEHVSGPAAGMYRTRVTDAARFEGMTITSKKAARRLLSSPELKIHRGDAIHCVYNPEKALCRVKAKTESDSPGPDFGDCQRSCANIARTDQDIEQLRRRASELRATAADRLSPPLRHQREQHELDRISRIIENHEKGRVQWQTTPPSAH